MKITFWKNWPFTVQLTLTMAVVVAVAVMVVTWVNVFREQENARRELLDQAEILLTTLSATQANALYTLDTDSLTTAMESLGATQAGIEARIYDADGRLVADSAQEQSLSFNVDADPFGQELTDSSAPIVRWESAYLEIGQSVLVGRQSIGAVSLQVSTAQLDARLREAIQQGRLVALMAVVAGAGIALLVSRAFTRPIQEIAGVARRITGGDLTTRANLESQNEIGQLAQAFNGMLDAIQKRETELTEQAEALRIATAKAKEAARVKGEFLANVSHELRTPLNAIIGFSDMLLAGMSGPLNDKQQHKLTRLKDNGARLLNLINDLLDLTRIEAGRVEMIEKPYAPQGLVQRMSAQMESLAAASGLKFEAVVDPLMPPMVVGDEKRVEQVIVNLISNAIKFTKEGSVSICLAAHPADDTWTLSVIDTGIGIPPHALNIIFEEFRQLDGSYSRAYKGSGLGLAITRNLVRTMGGKITVKSEVGSGSTFTVTLPLVTPVAQKVSTGTLRPVLVN